MCILSSFIIQYQQEFAQFEDDKLGDFVRRVWTLRESVEKAVYGVLPDGRRDARQIQLNKNVLNKVTEKLSEEGVLERIGECKSFSELFKIIYDSKVSGFGALSVYDTSLRLGAYFGLSPEVVYLHSCAHEGAVNLLGMDFYKQHVQYFLDNDAYRCMSKEHFPEELQQLSPRHIESFLCIYKRKFNNG